MADSPDATKKTAASYNAYNSGTPALDKLRAAAKSILGIKDDDDEDEAKKKTPPTNAVEAIARAKAFN